MRNSIAQSSNKHEPGPLPGRVVVSTLLLGSAHVKDVVGGSICFAAFSSSVQPAWTLLLLSTCLRSSLLVVLGLNFRECWKQTGGYQILRTAQTSASNLREAVPCTGDSGGELLTSQWCGQKLHVWRTWSLTAIVGHDSRLATHAFTIHIMAG